MMYKLYKSRLALTPLLYARKDEDLKIYRPHHIAKYAFIL